MSDFFTTFRILVKINIPNVLKTLTLIFLACIMLLFKEGTWNRCGSRIGHWGNNYEEVKGDYCYGGTGVRDVAPSHSKRHGF